MLKRYRILAAILAVLCLVPIFSVTGFASSAQSEGDQAMYVEKYVSVLYDNSGSMMKEKRSYYANYAFQMMVSMMNAEDTLWITPMNTKNDVGSLKDVVQFDFTGNRQSDIDSFVSNYLKDGKPLAPIGNAPTPLSTVSVAVDRLFKTDDIPGYNESRDRKHWLVILTDGTFTNDDGSVELKIEETVNTFAELLEANEKLNIIYVGMGTAADLTGTTYTDTKDGDKVKQNVLQQQYKGRFNALMANTPENVVAAMRDVVNLMSDRYTLKYDEADFITLSADKKTATVKLDYVPFPLNSVSFAVQNFGGTLTKATYGSKTFTPENCVIKPPTELGMLSGTTGIIRDDGPNPILFNTADSVGDLVLTFDKPIEEANIALMAEPSLYIRSVFEYKKDGKWVEGTCIDLMKNLQEGDKIRVGYRVYNGATGKPFTDIANQLPGTTYGTVYLGNTLKADKLTGMSDEITLSTGSNTVKMSVSLMDGIYRLEETVDIRIVGSTAGYSMTASHTPADASASHKTTTVFTPKKENQPMSKAELSTYTPTITVKNMDGVTVSTGATAMLQDNGTYVVSLDLSSQEFGEYTLELTLTDTISPVEMNALQTVQYYPAKVALEVEGDKEISKTQNGFKLGQYRAFTFLLKADGKAFDFNNGLLDYELKFGSTVIDKEMYTVLGNKLSFVPDEETVGTLLQKTPADYEITLSVSSTTRPNLSASEKVVLKITETKMAVYVVKNDKLPIDRFDIQDTPADVYFAVECDDAFLTADELMMALSLKEKDENSLIGTLTIESDWCNNPLYPVALSDSEITSLTVNGATVACVKVTVLPGHFGFLREHLTSWLIPKGDKPITASYVTDTKSAEVTTEFVMATSGAWSYIWRLLVILLWIHVIMAIVLNPTVPRHTKGYVVTLDVTGSASAGARATAPTAVNLSFMERAVPERWFIPFHPVKPQKKNGKDSTMVFDHYHAAKNAKGKEVPLNKRQSKAVCKRMALVFSAGALEGDAAQLFLNYKSGLKNLIKAGPLNANNTRPPAKLTNGMLQSTFAAVVEHEDVTAASNYVPAGGVVNGFTGGDKIIVIYETRGTGNRIAFGKAQRIVFFVPKK